MKNIIISFIVGLIVGATAMYFIKQPKPVEVEVPIVMEVPVPVISKEYSKVFFPVFKESKIDSNYYNKYKELKKDSIKVDSLIKELVTIRTYNEKVEDDTISINLKANVRGTLLDYQIGYKTKPYTIPLDTTIKVKIPQSPKFYFGAMVSAEFKNPNDNIGIGPTAAFLNRKQTKLFTFSYDISNNRKQVGVLINF